MTNGALPSHIYVAIVKDAVKIGVSCNLQQRVKAVASKFGGASLVWATQVYSDCRAIESHAHAELGAQHIGHELFECSPDRAIAAVVCALEARDMGTLRPNRNIAIAHSIARMQREKVACMSIEDRWEQPTTPETSTATLLAEVGLSRNTVNVYLGTRTAAQAAYQRREKRRKRKSDE